MPAPTNRRLLAAVAASLTLVGVAAPARAAAVPSLSDCAGQTIRANASGDCVLALQRALNELGYGLAEDGDYGQQTRHAVIDYQELVDLINDGEAGPQTIAMLTAGDPAPVEAGPAATRYVALGDSFSSGEGLDRYETGTDGDGNRCHRSPAAYPRLVAAAQPDKWQLAPEDFVACSGAAIKDVVYGGQLDRLAPDVANVSISIGGNDLEFNTVLRRCLYGFNLAVQGSRDCKNSVISDSDPRTLDQYERVLLESLGTGKACDDREADCGDGRIPSLHELYGLIAERAPEATIHVLLYPHLFRLNPTAERCEIYSFGPKNAFISQDNVDWLNAAVDLADNKILEEVRLAQEAGVKVLAVDPRPLYDGDGVGHGVCSPKPWIRSLKLQVDELPSPESFHPNADGHRAFATALSGIQIPGF